jgi:hypothetical protein
MQVFQMHPQLTSDRIDHAYQLIRANPPWVGKQREKKASETLTTKSGSPQSLVTNKKTGDLNKK